MYLTDEFRLKIGLAEQLKGGVIMDVTNAEQALIAEKAGANAVMALERVPSDIRKEGGVARMAPISKIREIMATVSIPVMAKCRIGHFAEASILEALKVDYIDESEVLTMADDVHHGRFVVTAADWLLDNFHLVTSEITDIRRNLPRRYARTLPTLASRERAGDARIYAIAVELIRHSDIRLDRQQLIAVQGVADRLEYLGRDRRRD